MARLRAVLCAIFALLPLLAAPPPQHPMPYSLLRLVEFKATDVVVEKDLFLSPTPDDGLESTQKCLGSVRPGAGGEFLCAAKVLFESQFEPKKGLIGADSFAAFRSYIANYTHHPCNHGNLSVGGEASPSAEVIIALQNDFVLYGCHNYLTLALQRPQNQRLSNFATLKPFKVPHSLVQFKDCADEEEPCTLTAVKYEHTLIAEDYVCCCNGSGCAAVIVDQGGWITPFPLLRFNIQLDEALTGKLAEMANSHAGGLYGMGANSSMQRRRHFRSPSQSGVDIIFICLIFFTIVGAMSLLLCFQWFCKDTIVNDV